MDFLTTLLAYMAASLVVAVESTSTPSVTPVPTPAPTPEERPAVVEMVTEIPSVAATAEPTATVSVTPEPVPTITPNTAAYHNLTQGDRGNEVRRLQEKLIELGYLPEGAADGAYGGQTRMAVRRFQYYNGLTVDGVAGRATQTNLFENPDAARYPGEATPTPAAEESPAPQETDAEPTDTPVPTVTPLVVAAQQTEAPKTEETEAPAEETAAPEETEATAEPAEETEQPAKTETGAPKAEETEEPKAEATAEPAEETEQPEEETEAPQAEENSEPEAEETAEPEADETEVPAEITASPVVLEIEETVDLDKAEETVMPEPTSTPAPIIYSDLAGWIVLNDSGENMQWTEMEDGVPVIRSPRLQRSAEGDIRVSLDDLSKSVEGWRMAEEEHSLVLEAEGYILALLNEDAGFVSTVDGIEMMTDGVDFSFSEGHFIPVDFLTRAMDGSWEWDEEEDTLMIRIPPKNGYTD